MTVSCQSLIGGMPRFLVETSPGDTSDRALRLAEQRSPYVSVEHRYTANDQEPRRVIWVCRAPSRAHIYRWTEAACLAVGVVQRFGDDDAALGQTS